MRTQYPNERDAHLLVILLSHFQPASWTVIEQALMVDVPAGVATRDQVLGERAKALFHAALTSHQPERVAQIQAWLAELPATTEGAPTLVDLRAEVHVLAVAAHQSTWAEVADVYRALLPAAADDETRARYEGNLGTALYRAGARDQARAAWDRVLTAQPTNEAVQLDRAAIAGPVPESIAELTKLSTDAAAAGVRFQAAAWLRAFAIQKGDKHQPTVEALRAKILTHASSAQPDGAYGIVSIGSLNVGLGYSTTERLVLNLSVTTQAFLVLPAPGTEK